MFSSKCVDLQIIMLKNCIFDHGRKTSLAIFWFLHISNDSIKIKCTVSLFYTKTFAINCLKRYWFSYYFP